MNDSTWRVVVATPPADAQDEAQRRRTAELGQEAAARFDAILRLPPRAEAARRAARSATAADTGSFPAPRGGVPDTTEPAAQANAETADDASAVSSPPSRPRTTPVVRRHGTRGDAPQSETGVPEPTAHRQLVNTASDQGGPDRSDDDAHSAFERLASRLADLCRRGAPTPDTWSIVLDMDPETLPQTELRIHASRDWIRLRFSTQSSRCVHLVSMHMDWLRCQLEKTLGMHQQVDVDFE